MNHCQRQRADAQGILNLRLGSGPETKLEALAGGFLVGAKRQQGTSGNLQELFPPSTNDKSTE